MNIWLCSIASGFLNTGRTYSWLHYSALASGCCSVLYLLGIAVRKHRSRKFASKAANLESTRSESLYWKELKGKHEGKIDGLSGPLSVIFAVGCMAIILFGASRLPRYPIVEWHNVEFLKHVNHNKWAIRHDGKNDFWTGCEDFPNEKVIWEGYLAAEAKFEERGECKSIFAANLYILWARDEHHDVIRVKEN